MLLGDRRASVSHLDRNPLVFWALLLRLCRCAGGAKGSLTALRLQGAAKGAAVTEKNVHRLIASAVLVSGKLALERYYSNVTSTCTWLSLR